VTADPEEGIKEVARHSDHFYDLTFFFDGKVDEKRIQVEAKNGNIHFSHIQKLSEKDVEDWIRRIAKKNIRIYDFSQEKNTIRFGMDSFMRDEKKRIGMIKVRISLLDVKRAPVFETQNTLRATEEKIVISIPLPQEHRGEYLLRIDAFDLLANTQTSSEHPVELEL
jgi:hypothetical protein